MEPVLDVPPRPAIEVPTMKFLVTGDRDWKNREVIYSRLNNIPRRWSLVHGAARGADSIAADLWGNIAGEELLIPVLANWSKWGKRAGPIRNKQMLNENPDIQMVIAFHNDISVSKGTKDMVMQAIRKGVPVEIISESTYGTLYEA